MPGDADAACTARPIGGGGAETLVLRQRWNERTIVGRSGAIRHPAPMLGEHTEEVIAEWLGTGGANLAASGD